MWKSIIPTAILVAVLLFSANVVFAQRTVILMEEGWKFHKGEVMPGLEKSIVEKGGAPEASTIGFDDSAWSDVSVPHDWAIYGPFDRNNDLQNVAVEQNGETKASLKTGRTGGLPYIGVGWYRRTFDAPVGKKAVLVFDGAMSEARVFINGEQVCYWPYGYSTFWCDVTDNLVPGKNTLAVRLENLPNSSRWYPGAGLYRNVHLILTDNVHVPVWGTRITVPHVKDDFASVKLETEIEGSSGMTIVVETDIVDGKGRTVTSRKDSGRIIDGKPFVQNFIVESPELWSPENPVLYKAVSRILSEDGSVLDNYETVFGIRTLAFIPEKGFYLNGERRKFQGVCNHHDLGPIGAAVNVSALRHQLLLLKDMGCDAIRTSHNLPAPELVRLCDEMGFMMMIEPFDEWDIAKCENGYHRHFGQWAEKDMVNMLRHYRNNPSVVMWSIGNEVPTQCNPEGYKVAVFLQNICHREDPTRPVTCGMDRVDCVLENGFASLIDIPGINYRTFRYLQAYKELPQGFVLGSETASTVSSRGVYKIPAEKRFGAVDSDHHCSSYDLDACSWSNIPDVDFALVDDYEWTLGQFVWTGFDYLGEPSPYDKDSWPNHSSMFGIIDLASIPKDRFWLYRSQWNKNEQTLHILPHWTWPGYEGKNIPVFVYTSYPEAEIFINGKSCGRLKKDVSCGYPSDGDVSGNVESRYRLIWNNAVYEPGELKVVGYDNNGFPAEERVIHTADKPHHIELEVSYPENEVSATTLKADGKSLLYITASVVDKDGNLCPNDSSLMTFSVSGAAKYKASANGDPTCLDIFHEPRMHVFNGKLTVIIQAGEKEGSAVLEVKSKGIKKAVMTINVN